MKGEERIEEVSNVFDEDEKISFSMKMRLAKRSSMEKKIRDPSIIDNILEDFYGQTGFKVLPRRN